MCVLWSTILWNEARNACYFTWRVTQQQTFTRLVKYASSSKRSDKEKENYIHTRITRANVLRCTFYVLRFVLCYAWDCIYACDLFIWICVCKCESLYVCWPPSDRAVPWDYLQQVEDFTWSNAESGIRSKNCWTKSFSTKSGTWLRFKGFRLWGMLFQQAQFF